MVINKNSKGRCRKHPQGLPLLERREMSEEYDRVRKEIARILHELCTKATNFSYTEYANQILKIEGIRIEAADQSLPNVKDSFSALTSQAKVSNQHYWRVKGHEDMVSAGFVKCLPKPK